MDRVDQRRVVGKGGRVPVRPGSFLPVPLRADRLPEVVLRTDLIGDAASASARDGRLLTLRRGAYVRTSALDDERHRRATDIALAHVVAVARQSPGPIVLSHTSAALLWGLPLLSPPTRVHLVQHSLPNGSAACDVVRHTCRLAPEDVAEVAGLRVTSLARTMIDCARTLNARGALVTVDAGLRSGVGHDELDAVLARAVGGRGVRQARAILELADGGAESPGESLARAAFLAIGLPPPQTQIRVDTAEGPFWPDMGWRHLRLLAEYDGRVKYGTAGDAEALMREKRREDLIRDERWRVVRVTSPDVARPALLESRLRRILPSDVRATFTPRPFLLP